MDRCSPTAMEVCSATSGEILLRLPAEEVAGRLVKDVKDLLCPQLGVSRFRQRLLDANLALMEDVIRLDIVPPRIQVITLPFNPCPTHQDILRCLNAAKNNDLATVQTMLTAALDPNTALKQWWQEDTPLHVAAREQHDSMIQLLLEACADVIADSKPMCIASMNGDIDTVGLLVARGASVNAGNPLSEAAGYGHVDVVRYLLGAGADMNSHEGNSATPLLQAVIRDRSKVVDILLAARANVNLGTTDGSTPLMEAASKDPPLPLLKTLLDAAADVNHADKTGFTALLAAAYTNNHETVKMLVEARADVNMFDEDLGKPLHVAAGNHHHSIIQLLLEGDADVTADIQPMNIVAETGDIETARLLVAKGASVNAGNTLGEAANRGHADLVRYLLGAGAEKNSHEGYSYTPLLEAVIERRFDVVDILLEAKANVNLGTAEGFTPLMQAACRDQPLLKALLDAAADVNQADKTGDTALLEAAMNNNYEAVRLLVQARAIINVVNDDIETPLFYAAAHNNAAMFSFLIERGAHVHQPSRGAHVRMHMFMC